MNTNKSLIVRKDNFITKLMNFFKGLFRKKIKEEIVEEVVVERNDARVDFLNSIKEQQDNPEIVKLQQAYENNMVKSEDMTYEQILNLNKLYKKQIKKIDEDLNMKKININILKKKIAN